MQNHLPGKMPAEVLPLTKGVEGDFQVSLSS